jgi:1-acyl-sn-glycerol-3-phosphate acyltransferase
VWAARWRLASLWLSQVGRVLADNCLRVFVVLAVARAGAAASDGAWHLATALLMLPAVLLAPLNGALGNSLRKRWVLVGSAACCLAVTAGLGLVAGPEPGSGVVLACWALAAVGAAVYSPTRYALLPAAAEDTRVPLTRVNGLIEMGAAAAVVGGWVVGGELGETQWGGWAAAVVTAVGLNLLATLAAVPAWFAADVRRPESAGMAAVGFFRDCGRVFRDPEARASLLGLAGLRGTLLALMGALVAVVLADQGDTAGLLSRLLQVGLWVGIGAAAGSLLAGLQRHQRRALGLVPPGATALLLGVVLAAAGGLPSPGLCLALGAAGGLVNVPLAAKYQASVPPDARGNAMAVRSTVEYLLVAAAAGLFAGLAYLGVLPAAGQLWLVAGLAAVGTALSWWVLTRNTLELALEVLVWPCYRVRAHGPGFDHFPGRGPVLVVSNHTAWLDPVWLGKVVPRKMTPMMTSLFYDLPVLRWWMRHVVRAIRVQVSGFRREAPELREAIRVLDGGGCVVLFPEGSLRRSPDRPLRPFGQGVWHILHERPQTPVVVCWIEGGWGSYFSYAGGPPTKNKALDLWRPIAVAAGPPLWLGPEVLASHRETRAYLQQACLDARRYLGLQPFAVTAAEEEPAAGAGAP